MFVNLLSRPRTDKSGWLWSFTVMTHRKLLFNKKNVKVLPKKLPGSVKEWKNKLKGTSEVLRDERIDWGVIGVKLGNLGLKKTFFSKSFWKSNFLLFFDEVSSDPFSYGNLERVDSKKWMRMDFIPNLN